MKRERIDLGRDVLDKQIIDAEETKMGRVDGIVLAIDGDAQPHIDHLELGFAVLARRLHPRLERWLQSLRERWSVRRSARQVIPWAKVSDLTVEHLQVDFKAWDTPAFDWERAARKVVKKIPGAGDAK
jgi:LmbE family N-acetylglucosaminyl deacetylase